MLLNKLYFRIRVVKFPTLHVNLRHPHPVDVTYETYDQKFVQIITDRYIIVTDRPDAVVKQLCH